MSNVTAIHAPGDGPNRDASLALSLGDGDAQTAQTIAAMVAVIHDATGREPVKRFTAWATATYRNMVPGSAVFWALRDRVKFKADTPGVEHLRHPEQLITEIEGPRGYAEGDCDDRSMLGAAMLATAGLTPVLIVMGRDPKGPFEHVFFGYRKHTGMLPMDPLADVVALDPQETEAPGKVHAGAARLRVYDV